MLAFSDSVIVNIPLQSEVTEREGTLDPMMTELVGMAYSQFNCVVSDLFLRGGVDLGWWYRSGDILVSPSLVRAYNAERNACVPVIALTDDLYGFFSSHRDRRFYSADVDPLKSFRRYDGDKASCWYLDYLSICAESVGHIESFAQRQAYFAAAPNDKQQIINRGTCRSRRTRSSTPVHLLYR